MYSKKDLMLKSDQAQVKAKERWSVNLFLAHNQANHNTQQIGTNTE